MNKTELIAKVAEKTDLTKKAAEAAVNATFDAVAECMAAGDKLQLVGFGTFEVRHRGERVAHNPQTKEEIKIPAADIPAFKPGKALKDAVDKK